MEAPRHNTKCRSAGIKADPHGGRNAPPARRRSRVLAGYDECAVRNPGVSEAMAVLGNRSAGSAWNFRIACRFAVAGRASDGARRWIIAWSFAIMARAKFAPIAAAGAVAVLVSGLVGSTVPAKADCADGLKH